MSIGPVVQRLGEIDRRQASYLARATWHLLRAGRAHRSRPMQEIIGDLRRPLAVGVERDQRFSPALAGWAVRAMALRVPWRADCLIQAMAAGCWLRRHGYAGLLHLGVARPDPTMLEAHAWLTLDGTVIVGDLPGGLDVFQPILDMSKHEAQGVRWD